MSSGQPNCSSEQKSDNMQTAASSWGDMSSDIGHLILTKLPEVVEHIRFGAVCKQWDIISKEYHQEEELLKSRKDVLPMLLVPSLETPAGRDPPRLYALSCLGKYYSSLQLHKVPYSSNRYNRYCGSSYGWIAFQNEDGTVTLIYPFGRKVLRIDLPGLHHWINTSYCMEVNKLFVLPGSTPDDYTVVAIYEGMKELATIKSGENSWVYIPPRPQAVPASLFSDIVYYKGHVYAVSVICMIVKVDVQARPPVVKIVHPLNRKNHSRRTYLVESTSSDLFLLQRRYDDSDLDKDLTTDGFKLYMVKLKDDKGELIHMDLKSLKGDTFFVGDNTSIAIRSDGCMPNSIYFTDDLNDPGYYKPSGPIDVGYYNIEDGTIERHYKANSGHKEGVSRPIWIVPHQHILRFLHQLFPIETNYMPA